MVTGTEVHNDTVPAVPEEESGNSGQDEGGYVCQQGETRQYKGRRTTQECPGSETK